jgi:ligand-binding sensor domain-containing protein
MKITTSLIIGLLCLWLNQVAKAQTHTSKLFSIKDKFYINQPTSVHIDVKGNLWVGSYGDDGVARFNGRDFKYWTRQQGLFSGDVTIQAEDEKGNIWVGKSSDDIAKGKVVCLFPDGKTQFFDCPTSRIFYDSIEGISVFHRFGWLSTFNSDKKKLSKRSIFNKPDTILNMWQDPFRPRYFMQTTQSGLSIFENKQLKSAIIPTLSDGTHLFHLNATTTGQIFALTQKGIYTLQNNQWLLKQGWASLAIDFSSNSRRKPIFSYKKGKLLIHNLTSDRFINEILEFDSQLQLLQTYRYRYPSVVASDLTRDPAGNFWIATFNGLFKVCPHFFNLTPFDNNMISSLHSIVGDSKGRIWLGSYGEGVAFFDGKTIKKAPQSVFKNQNMLPGSVCDAQGNMYLTLEGAGKGGIIKFDGDNKTQRLLEGAFGFYLLESQNKHLLFGTTDGLIILKNRNSLTLKDTNAYTLINKKQGLKMPYVLTAVEDKKGRIWMGSGGGLAVYDTLIQKVTNFVRQDNRKDFSVMSSAMDTKGNLWFGTNQGLAFAKTPETIDSTFKPSKDFTIVGKDILGTSVVSIVKRYDERWLIVGNNAGFALLDVESFYNAQKQKAIIHFFQENNGYVGGSCEQNAVWIDNMKNIWVAGKNGAARIQPASFLNRDNISPILQLDSIRIGGQKFANDNPTSSELPLFISRTSGEQSVNLFINYDNSLNNDNIQIYYRFSDSDSFQLANMSKSSEGGIFFENLTTGSYELEVRIVKNNYFESNILKVPFLIRSFWQTSDFWFPFLLFSLIISMAIFSVFKRREKKMQALETERQNQEFKVREAEINEANLRQEKAQLKVQALMNQLNPHFIGNAVHWVQTRIYQNKEAVSVIGKLAENISAVFRNTIKNQPFHTLGEEMYLLNNYFIIQKFLLGNKLTYILPSQESYAAFKDLKIPINPTFRTFLN